MPTFREDPKLGSKVPMIKTADLNEQCVTSSKILDGCITKEKLAKGTVDATTLANKSVGTEKLSDSSVTKEKLADGSITKEKIFNASITTEKLANESVSAEKLQSGLRNTIASTYDKTIELDNQKANIADVGNAIERLENKIGERILVEGDVTNLPDEEDLTSVNAIDGREVMKLNDRAYEPSNFSGKGYKILRKNIKKFDIPTVSIVVSYAPTSSGDITITVNDKVITIHLDSTTDTTTAIVATKIATSLKSSLDDYDVSVSSNRITLTRHNGSSVSPSLINVGSTSAVISVNDSITKNVRKNILGQDMVNDPNTVYEIRYDFDLNREEIKFKPGCTLVFNGGSFSNGVLYGQDTRLKYVSTIFYHITINGSWKVPKIYSYLYGNVEEDNLYNLLALQNESIYNYIYISGDKEYVVTPRDLGGMTIKSNCTVEINATIRLKVKDNTAISFILQLWKPGIGKNNRIENVYIKGAGVLLGNFEESMPNYNPNSLGVRLYYSNNVKIEGIKIQNVQGDGVSTSVGCDNIRIENVHVSKFGRNGFSIVGSKHTFLLNCSAENGGYSDPYAAIDIEPNISTEDNVYKENGVIIKNFTAINCSRAICSYCPTSSYIHSISIENLYIENCGIHRTDIHTLKEFNGDIFSLQLNDTIVSLNNIKVFNGQGALGRIRKAECLLMTNCYIQSPLLTGLSLLDTKRTIISNSCIECNDYIFLPSSKNIIAKNNTFTAKNLFHLNNTNPIHYTSNILFENNTICAKIVGVLENAIFRNNIIKITASLQLYEYLIGWQEKKSIEGIAPIFTDNIIEYSGENTIDCAVNIGIEGMSFIHNKMFLQNTDKGIAIQNVKNTCILDNIIEGSTSSIVNYADRTAANYPYMKGKTRPEYTIKDIQSEGSYMYDINLKKMILWNGSSWVNVDGTSL